MKEFARPLILTSPNVHGDRVKDAQYLLTYNRFRTKFYEGARDGVYGPKSAEAAKHAKYLLGYPKKAVNGSFGTQLYNYLRMSGGKRLPVAYRLRRKLRLAQEAKKSTIKKRALVNALRDVGIEENPPYSNNVKFCDWYGFRGPWCMMAVSKWRSDAGSKIPRSAWAYWPENMARAHQYGMSITSNPEPGDIVVYHIFQGHVGLFKEWVNRREGTFLAVEGNTSQSSDDNGGKVMIRSRGPWNNPVFVRTSL